MRDHKPRRNNRFRSNYKGFRRNGSQDTAITGANSVLNNFQGSSFSRNGQNPERLLEKYSTLAKEASSDGDRILSESYYQHADHFLRIVQDRNSLQNNSKLKSQENPIQKTSDNKIIIKKDEKNSTFQETQNNKEI